MTILYINSLKQTRMEAVITAIDSGSGAGKLVIMDAADAVLATLTLADPCGTALNGLLTFDMDPDIAATGTGAGDAAKAKFTTSADAVVVSGLTVGTAEADIIIDNTTINIGQTVTCISGTITHG
jgi:hypothetical protein